MEVCIDNIQSAINAEEGGATRIELCSSLSEGGLTPTLGFFHTVKALVRIPIFVMIRPRRGNFVYSKEELSIMKQDALYLKDAGADGFVFGILNENGTVNMQACRNLLDTVRPKPCTFHRAFDVVANPFESLENIIDLGFSRLLTSGQKPTAMEGLDLIRRLIEKARDQIIIMPGSGISESNIKEIANISGVKEVHGSVRTELKLKFSGKVDSESDEENLLLVTDKNRLRSIVSIVNMM